MKYRLGDVCTIEKGATGIMKAVPGPYPMVTLAEERKQHSEYQFDAAAVIVPLISSTGHGHASIKRLHYQKGKFALGTILCAVIPKDATQLSAYYLYVYLQQFKDSLLVPLMKGAANVSLPLGKLAALEIEVPTPAKQQEIIALAEVLTGHRNELESLLSSQEADVSKLHQALLREAMQGQLLPQDPTDEPAAVLLQQMQVAKPSKKGRGQAGALFAEEAEAVEGPFEIPASWVWCTLGDTCGWLNGYAFKSEWFKAKGIRLLRNINMKVGAIDWVDSAYLPNELANDFEQFSLNEGDIVLSLDRPIISGGLKVAQVSDSDLPCLLLQRVLRIEPGPELDSDYLFLFLKSFLFVDYISPGRSIGIPHISHKEVMNALIPLPPLAEQHRIVAKLEQLLGHCDALEQRIRESRRLAEQLLATALREALAPPNEVNNSIVEQKSSRQLTLL